jgi:hypothetical protein
MELIKFSIKFVLHREKRLTASLYRITLVLLKRRRGMVEFLKWRESKWGRAVLGRGVLIFKFLPFPFSSPFKINKLKQKFVNLSLNFVCVFNDHFLLGYLLSDIIYCVLQIQHLILVTVYFVRNYWHWKKFCIWDLKDS